MVKFMFFVTIVHIVNERLLARPAILLKYRLFLTHAEVILQTELLKVNYIYYKNYRSGQWFLQ